MVGTIKGITIELEGKTTKLTAALKEADTPARNLQTSLNNVNKALKLDPTNTELLSEKQKILASYVDVTRDKLQKMEDVQDQIRQQYANGEIDQGSYLAFQNELEKTKAKLKSLEDQQKSFGSVVQQQLEAAGQKVSEFGDKVSGVGANLTKGITAPITAAGTAAMAAFSKVDDGVDIIVKATGAQGEALNSLSDSYKKVASEMPADMEVVASAVGEVNTRFHTIGEELENQTRLLIQYAEITGGDVVQATDDADKTLKAWGKSAEDLPGLLGMVASKAQETGINAQGLMQDVLANSASFKELGFSLEESINLMAQLDANGVDSSAALTGLKKAVVNLTDAGMGQDEALRAVIDSIKNASTETEALQIAQETFGTKGAAEMATAIREGRIDIDALSDSVKNYGSVVEETYGGVVGDATDEAKTAMNALTIAGAEFGETINGMLAPAISDIAELIRNATQYLNGLDDGQKKTIVTIAAIVAAVGPILTVGGKLISGIGSMISWMGKIPTAISAVQTGFTAVSGVLSGAFSGAISAAGSTMSFLAANPIVAVVAAVAALVAGLIWAYNNVEWFRDGVNAAIETVKEIWSATVETVKGVLEGLSQTWNNVTSAIKNITSSVMTAASDTIKQNLSNIKNAYEENGGGIQGIVAASMEAVKGLYTSGWTFIDNLTGGKLTDVVNSIREKMDIGKEAVSNAISKIKSLFNFSWNWPHLTLPHFSITGSFSLNPPSIPKIGVEWYAKGGILSGAQIFGAMGNTLLGGGENGPEAVLPLSSFYDNLRSILASFAGVVSANNTVKVELHIEHFENYSNQDLDEITKYVEDRIQSKIDKRGAALS